MAIKKQKKYTVYSLFTGAGGFDIVLDEKAGMEKMHLIFKIKNN